MPEHYDVPQVPPTHYVFAEYTSTGEYQQPRPVFPGIDEQGSQMLTVQPPQEFMPCVDEILAPQRKEMQAQLISSFDGVPRAAAAVAEERHVDHFFRALGLPTAPAVAVPSATMLPHRGFAAPFTANFTNNPSINGLCDANTRTIIVAEQAVDGRRMPLAHTLAHEKAHSTGQDAFAIRLDDEHRMHATVVRHGFEISPPVSLGETPVSNKKHEATEEAQAMVWAAAYGDLFLPHPEAAAELGWLMPGKYINDIGENGSNPFLMAALSFEAIAEKDPAFLDTLIASRLSIDGLRRFARHTNDVVPGLYGELLHCPAERKSARAILQRTVDTLYDGRWSPLASLGGVIRQYVVGKLETYEQKTGYDFGPPKA